MGFKKIVNDSIDLYDAYQNVKKTEGEARDFEEWLKRLKKDYQKEGLHPDDYLVDENKIWNEDSIKFILKFLKKHGSLMNSDVFSTFSNLIIQQSDKANFDISNYLVSIK